MAKTTRRKAPVKATHRVEPSTVITTDLVYRRIRATVAVVLALAAVVAAWSTLDWPVPATRFYVQDTFSKIAKRIDNVDVLGLQNRLETLRANTQAIQREKADLDVKTHTVKDYVAQQLIQNRQLQIGRDLDQLNQQVQDTQAQIKSIQK